MTTQFFIPTKKQILDLKVGSLAPDFTGTFKPIVEITAKQQDVNGKWFCCYYVGFGANSRVSDSLKEDELHRNIKTSANHTSAELDKIETEMLNKRNYAKQVENKLLNNEWLHWIASKRRMR